MRIGLIAVDGRGGFPNLALMRLSTWHKRQGDAVDWWNGFERYDRVYMSKVFTFTPDFDTAINAEEIITGGTGYKDFGNLPPEIEACPPDYTLYPQWKSAIGFLTRGCCRHCEWCVVPQKEGTIHPAATWEEIKRPDSREMILLDNNVLASDHGLDQIDRMGHEPVWIDFNQGLDARLITPEIARMLARLHWIRFVRLACDTLRNAASDPAGYRLSAESGYFTVQILGLCAGTGRGRSPPPCPGIAGHGRGTFCPALPGL